MDHLNPFLSYAFQHHGDIPAWTGRFDKTVPFRRPSQEASSIAQGSQRRRRSGGKDSISLALLKQKTNRKGECAQM